MRARCVRGRTPKPPQTTLLPSGRAPSPPPPPLESSRNACDVVVAAATTAAARSPAHPSRETRSPFYLFIIIIRPPLLTPVPVAPPLPNTPLVNVASPPAARTRVLYLYARVFNIVHHVVYVNRSRDSVAAAGGVWRTSAAVTPLPLRTPSCLPSILTGSFFLSGS